MKSTQSRAILFTNSTTLIYFTLNIRVESKYVRILLNWNAFLTRENDCFEGQYLLVYRNQIFSGHSSLVLDIRRYILCSFLFRGVLDRPKTRILKYPVHQRAKKETSLYISGCVSTHALSIQRPCISISRKANFQMFFAKCFGNKNVTCCPTPVLFL